MPKQRRKIDSIAGELRREALQPCTHYLSTGCTLLDLAISNSYPGGVGGGRITHFYGDSSTAKSVIVQEVLGSAQRQGGIAIFEDAEYTLDFERASLFGLNTGNWSSDKIEEEGDIKDDIKGDNNFVCRHPNTIEQLFDEEIGRTLELMKEGKLTSPVAIGIDSLTALPSKVEAGEELDKASYDMSRAKMFSKAFRKYICDMSKLGLSIIIIDQTRTNVGAMVFAKKHVTSGGKAKDFYRSTGVLLKYKGKIKNKHKKVVGVTIGFEIEKNKIAPPFREGEFQLLFDIGIDDLSSNLEWLKQQIIDSNVESSFACAKNGRWQWKEEKYNSMSELVSYVEKNNLEEEVEKEVARIWQVVYEPSERKKRYE